MNVSNVLKAAGGFYVVGLAVTLLALPVVLPAIVWVLGTVLGGLSSFGQGWF